MYNNTLWNRIFNGFRYNCPVFSEAEMSSDEHKNIYLGSSYLILSSFYLIVYFPFIVAIGKSHLKLSVYKFLFFLGIIDSINIVISGTVTGIFTINGTFYCEYPTTIFVLGSVALGIWIATDLAVTLLLVSRIIDALYPDLAEKLFHGYRTCVWIGGITIFSLFVTFCSPPVIFSPIYYSWFFDPNIGATANVSHDYGNIYHTINNFFIFGSQFTLYITIVFVYLNKNSFKGSGGQSNSAKKLAIRLFIQSAFICFLTLTTSALYLAMMFLNIPPWISILGNFFWLSTHGISGPIFLALNNTLKHTIKSWFKRSQISAVVTLVNPTKTIL